MRVLKVSLCLLTATALLAPIASDAKTSKMMPIPSGKAAQVRTTKIGGQATTVPTYTGCDVFHVSC